MSIYGNRLREAKGRLLALEPIPGLESLLGIPGGQVFCKLFRVAEFTRYQDLLQEGVAHGEAQIVTELALDREGKRLFDMGDMPVLADELPKAWLSNLAAGIVASQGEVLDADPLPLTESAQPVSSLPAGSDVRSISSTAPPSSTSASSLTG